jgi:16S rRNA (guanine(966)-N(2))-methyltransferase RsmD
MSGLRIIAGSARGMRIRSVPGDTTRPITDRAKESLFNIIGSDIIGASFLDLFGGTGSVGIEALSRGASYVRFLDLQRQAIETIRQNLNFTHLEKGGEVIRLDAFAMLSRPPDREFDYIFVAPPQYKELWKRIMQALDGNPGWLNRSGWIIVQIHPVEYQALALVHFAEFDQRKYGSTLFVFYQYKETG